MLLADLRPLMVTSEDKESYFIADGDIPCTPEVERTYSYMWNFCGDITAKSFPKDVCDENKMGSAIQYYHRASDEYKECHVIGHYDPQRDDTFFRLYDEHDPSKGVSMTYIYGESCPSGKLRSLTVDVLCANSKFITESALEPDACEYHMVARSWYGCPSSCPVTSNGLCNNQGHCAYDRSDRTAHCYCNTGYGGDACADAESSFVAGSSMYSLQMGLLVTLLLVALALVGVVGYLAYRVSTFRKHQYHDLAYPPATEMVDRVL